MAQFFKFNKCTGVHYGQIPADELTYASQIVEILKTKYGVKLLALDYDETLVDIPVMPFAGDAAQLAKNNFRMCFKAIMTVALERELACCVVSYNCDRNIISKTIEQGLPNRNAAKNVLVVTSESSANIRDFMYKNGKQQHLQLAKREFEKANGYELKPLEIFLFDDNEVNVRLAVSAGHHGYLVKPSVSSRQILEFMLERCSQQQADQRRQQQPARKEVRIVASLDPRLGTALTAIPASDFGFGRHVNSCPQLYTEIPSKISVNYELEYSPIEQAKNPVFISYNDSSSVSAYGRFNNNSGSAYGGFNSYTNGDHSFDTDGCSLITI